MLLLLTPALFFSLTACFLFLSRLLVRSSVYLFICDKSHFAYIISHSNAWICSFNVGSIQISNDILYEPSFSMLSKSTYLAISHVFFSDATFITVQCVYVHNLFKPYTIRCILFIINVFAFILYPFKIDVHSFAKYSCKTTFDAKIH